MELTTVKVSEKGQIAIPSDVRKSAGIKKGDVLIVIEDNGKILLQKAQRVAKKTKSEFEPLLKQSEAVAKKFWGTKADDVWDTI